MPSKLTTLNSFFCSAVKKLATSKALVVTIVLIAIVNFSSNFYFLIILLSKVSGCLRYSFFPFSLLSTSSKPNTLGPIMTSTVAVCYPWHSVCYSAYSVSHQTKYFFKLKKHQNDIKGERHRERSTVWARRG